MEFRILSGEAYAVQADTAEQAMAVANAYFMGEGCPEHGEEYCKCIEEIEADTIVVNEPDRSRFYAALTEALATWAKAERIAQSENYADAAHLGESKFAAGFAEGMEQAFALLLNDEINQDFYETSCDDFECDGKCNSNYCENFGDSDDDE
jgi:hypothetical protein